MHMGLFNPLNQALFTDRNKEYYAIVAKDSNRVLNVIESKSDLTFYDSNKVELKRTDLITLFIHDLLFHHKMTKTEAIIWAYGFFERVNIDFVLKHFNCSDLKELRTIYYKDPALFKFQISKLLNFDMDDFDKEFIFKDINESTK